MSKSNGRIYKQAGCSTWSIVYFKAGRRIRESTGSRDESVAKQRLRQRLHELDTGEWIQHQNLRVSDLWEAYEREMRINDRKRPQVTTTRWKKHLEPFFGYRRIMSVGTDQLDQYVDARRQEQAANATINREMAVLRKMFRLGYYATPRKVAHLPKFPHLREDNARTGFIEPQDYKSLAAAAPDLAIRAMLEIYYTYGWRKSELIRMRVNQIDLKARVIRLEPGTTKNREGREVFMTDTVHMLLTECAHGKNPDSYLFTREGGKPVLEFKQAWKKMCDAAGIVLLLHDLRRTAARNLRRAGVAEGVIMKIGGWKTRSVFERYNIVSSLDRREAMMKLEIARSHDFSHDSPQRDEQENRDENRSYSKQ
jgi:integrase